MNEYKKTNMNEYKQTYKYRDNAKLKGGSLKVLDFATQQNATNADYFITVFGLKSIFPLLKQKRVCLFCFVLFCLLLHLCLFNSFKN